MGQFVPVAMALTAAATAATGYMSYRSSVEAGKAQNAQAKMAANQEADAAREREIDRRRSLLKALATQTAAAGTAGVSTRSGTALASLAREQIKEAKNDTLLDTVNTGRERNKLLAMGKNAKMLGRMQGASSLLDTAVNLGTQYYQPKGL